MSDVIKTIGQLIPGDVNTPLDARTRVATLNDIANIQNPFIGCMFYCEADSKFYVVKTLKATNISGETVANAAIDTYEEFKGGSTPTIGDNGNWFIDGEDSGVSAKGSTGSPGEDGEDGTTFTPEVDSDGNLSWTNNGGLNNPPTVNIKGKNGDPGKDGTTFIPTVSENGVISWTNDGDKTNPESVSIKGKTGTTFTPSIDSNGNISWTNDGGLENPPTVNVKGDTGAAGEDAVVRNFRVEVTEVNENGDIVLDDPTLFPIAVVTDKGNAYNLDNGCIKATTESWIIDISSFLAYDNVAQFNPTWYVFCAGGIKGEQGLSFNPDARGLLSERSQYDSEEKAFAFLDIENGEIYFKLSDAAGDWTNALPFRGETGPAGYTFTPHISENNILSWTNNGGLSNPDPVNLKTFVSMDIVVSDTEPDNPQVGTIWVDTSED